VLLSNWKYNSKKQLIQIEEKIEEFQKMTMVFQNKRQ
jgi:hypothetical protein